MNFSRKNTYKQMRVVVVVVVVVVVCVCVCERGGGWMAWGWEGNGNIGLATFLKKIPGIFRFATLPSKNSGQNKLSISFTSTSAVVTASNELSNIYN